MEIIPIDSIIQEVPPEFFNLRTSTKETEKSNKFIAEGPEVVLRLLLSGHLIECLLIDDKQFGLLKEFIESKYQQSPFKIFLSSKRLISEIVGFKVHQGVLGLGGKPENKNISQIKFPAMALNGLVNGENVGGIVRTAQAFGIKTFIIDKETCDPWIRRCVRVSMGTIFGSDVFYCEKLLSYFAEIRAQKSDLKIVSLEQDERALSIYDKNCPNDFDILVLGSEKGGVDKEILDSCAVICEIPIDTSSLNSINVNCALSAFLAVLGLNNVN